MKSKVLDRNPIIRNQLDRVRLLFGGVLRRGGRGRFPSNQVVEGSMPGLVQLPLFLQDLALDRLDLALRDDLDLHLDRVLVRILLFGLLQLSGLFGLRDLLLNPF